MVTHYLYVNTELVDEYCAQLGFTDEQVLSKIQSKASISLGGPRFESNREYSNASPRLTKKIEWLVIELVRQNLVSRRPQQMPLGGAQLDQPFGLEVVKATKLTFGKKHLEHVPGVKGMAVWIADPDPTDLSGNEKTFTGTFLLLPQLHFDDAPFHSVHSGCSALQAIMNAYDGKPLVLGAGGEPLGRGSDVHPVEKLIALGAMASPAQDVRVLYRMRYMTNEQCYVHNGAQYRVNDLLAYPLFIAQGASKRSHHQSQRTAELTRWTS